MQTIIAGEITITDPTPDIVAWARENLTFENPNFEKLARIGVRCAPTIKAYTHRGNKLTIPRGVIKRVPVAGEWLLYTTNGRPAWYQSAIVLRDHQAPAVEAAMAAEQGVLELPCGAGKTEIGLEVIARRGRAALWLTHSGALLAQAMERAQARLGLTGDDIGVIGGGSMTVGRAITFATVQTLAARDIEPIRDLFGTIVVDECHHVFKGAGRAQFERVIRRLPATYRYGLTATPNRADGLTGTMYAVMGPTIYRLEQREVAAIVPTVCSINGMHIKRGAVDLQRFDKVLAALNNPERNAIVRRYVKWFVADGRRVLVLGSRCEHLQALMEDVPGARYIDGKTPMGERLRALDDMREGRGAALFATYSMAREGLDIPALDALVLATPLGDESTIQQAVGRIMRTAPDKADAVVVDIVDDFSTARRAYRRRRAVYEALGCEIGGEAA